MLCRLWDRMGAMLGPRWTGGFGKSPVLCPGTYTPTGRVWAEALADLTEEDIANGVKAVANDQTWWPTLPAFRGLCKASEIWEQKGDAYRELGYQRRLTKKRDEKSKAAGNAALGALREAIGKAERGELPPLEERLEHHAKVLRDWHAKGGR